MHVFLYIKSETNKIKEIPSLISETDKFQYRSANLRI